MVIKKSICISNKTRCDKQSGEIAVIPMVYEAYLYWIECPLIDGMIPYLKPCLGKSEFSTDYLKWKER